jgi:hypothetical protein
MLCFQVVILRLVLRLFWESTVQQQIGENESVWLRFFSVFQPFSSLPVFHQVVHHCYTNNELLQYSQVFPDK